MAVTKIIEVVGSSTESSDGAVQAALSDARQTLRNIKAVDVVSTGLRGDNRDGRRSRSALPARSTSSWSRRWAPAGRAGPVAGPSGPSPNRGSSSSSSGTTRSGP